jgi:hypothetical protein
VTIRRGVHHVESAILIEIKKNKVLRGATANIGRDEARRKKVGS